MNIFARSIVILNIFSQIYQITTTNLTDCFIVRSKFKVKCYKLITDNNCNHDNARLYCRAREGDLALITDDRTWNLTTERFRLELLNSEVWLRPYVESGQSNYGNTAKLIDAPGLNQTTFWQSYRLQQNYYNKLCMYVQTSDFTWKLQECYKNLPFLCEFNVTHCDVADISIPNANFNSCHKSKMIANNESIKIECWKGYHITDKSDYVICQNGKWQEPIPKCAPGCGHPGEKRNSELITSKAYYEIGEKAIYVCKEHYFYSKDFSKTYFTLFCQNDASWSVEVSFCTRSEFITINVDISNPYNEAITLNCTLENTNTTWFTVSTKTENPMPLEVLPSGNLQLTAIKNQSEGLYYCQGYIADIVYVGNIFYKLVDQSKCDTLDNNIGTKINRKEGQSVILDCPQQTKEFSIKWYKDDDVITILNANRIILPNNGLYLRNVQLSDEGIYKCESVPEDNERDCKYNTTITLTVTATERSVCGLVPDNVATNHQPWLIILQQEDEVSPFCYGALLNEQWAITSAFCLSSLRRKRKIKGVYLETYPDGYNQKYLVQSIKVHPAYRSQLYTNNIGLVKLQLRVQFGNSIRPICFDNTDFLRQEKCDVKNLEVNGTVAGWGSLLVDDPNEMSLRIENETLVSQEKCHHFFGFSEDMFCVKNSESKDVYAGDSGSPFAVDYKGRKYLMGIFNWGERITHTGKYDYFTSIFHHYDWIKETIETY